MKRGFKRGLLIVLMLAVLATVVLGGTLTVLNLTEPQVIYVEQRDTLKFDFSGQEYDILITNFYTYSVEFEITGKLNYFILHEGESVDINLDDFGDNDLKITAQTLVPAKKATLRIERINTQVPIIDSLPFRPVMRPVAEEENVSNETTAPVVTPTPEIPPAEEPELVPVEEQPAVDYTKWIYSILIIVVVAFLLMFAVYLKISSYAVAGVPPKLIKYVKNAIALEMPPEEIRDNMKESGWNDDEVDLAFKNVMGKLETSAA
ncbi:MAG: hypothetical protein KJ574_02750 [Nanoarchaeota archaeon]|nr:hypothetical protein [Nanoarchaeota archaeon]